MIDNRQGQAFILGGQHQEDQQQHQRENERARVTGQDLLVGQFGPFVVDALRQGFGGDALDGGLRLAGRIARGRSAVDIGGQEAIIAAGGPDRRRCRPSARRPAGPFRRCRADLQRADVLRPGAKGGVGLDPDAVGAAEAIEVVDIVRAEIDLQRLEDIGDRDAQLCGLGAVEIGVELRRVDVVAGEQPASSGV